MDEPEKRTRGVVRISVHSVLRALYGDTDYKAVSVRISKEDKSMLDITVSGPDLPEYKPGRKLQRIDIKRNYQEKSQDA